MSSQGFCDGIPGEEGGRSPVREVRMETDRSEVGPRARKSQQLPEAVGKEADSLLATPERTHPWRGILGSGAPE